MNFKEIDISQDTTNEDVILTKVVPCRRMVSLLNNNYNYVSQLAVNRDKTLCSLDDGPSYRQFVNKFYCMTQANLASSAKYRCLACNLKFILKSCLEFHLTMSFNVVTLNCAHADCNNSKNSGLLKFPNHCALILHLRSHLTTSTSNDIYSNVRRVCILSHDVLTSKPTNKPSDSSVFKDIAEFLDCQLDDQCNDIGLIPLPLRAVENLIKVLPDQNDVRELLTKKKAKFTCPECQEEISNGVSLHMASEKLSRFSLKYPCTICGLPLVSNCALKAHSRLHTATCPFVCPECGMKFPMNDQNFENHVYNGPCQHGSLRQLFKCPVCPDFTKRQEPSSTLNKNGYLTMDEFYYHMIGEHPNLLFLNNRSTKIVNLRKIVCCYCRFGPGPPPGPSDTFDNDVAFAAHLVCSFSCPRSTPFKLCWYQCSMCEFEHVDKAQLTNHVRNSHPLYQSLSKFQPQSCHFCRLSFSNVYFLNHHLTFCHSDELFYHIPRPIILSPSKNACKDMSTKTISYDDVLGLQVRPKDAGPIVNKKRDVRKSHHLALVKNAVKVKNKQLSSAPTLTRTIQNMKNPVNVNGQATHYHKCAICHIFLPKKLSLVLHGARHLLSADKTYAACCLACNNLPFKFDEEFQSHLVNEHHGTLKCEHCNLNFKTSGDYVLHLKVLLEKKNEICGQCGQAFTHARFLKRHNELYHKKARWVCYRCWVCYERCFSKISSLLEHLQVTHKIPRSQLDMRLVNAHKYSNFITSPLKQTSTDLGSLINGKERCACEICGFFDSESTLNGHVCLKTNGKSDETHVSNKDLLHDTPHNSESQRANNQASSSIRCQVCYWPFATEEDLKRHGRIHGMAFLIAHRNP